MLLEESSDLIRKVQAPLSGNDSADNLHVCHSKKIDYIIKANLRKKPKETWLRIAETTGMACEQRDGKIEQFHSEIKTDLDLERLPAGKFAINDHLISSSPITLSAGPVDSQG